jgi:hypothetical protein
MKRRWGLLLALFLLALVVGGVLVAQSPRARVRWLEFRARSSDRKVREEARWALFASRPAVEDDEFVELVAAEVRDVNDSHGAEFLGAVRSPASAIHGRKVHDYFRAQPLAGPCPTQFDGSDSRLLSDAARVDSPGLLLGSFVIGGSHQEFPVPIRFVLLDPALEERIEKLARH